MNRKLKAALAVICVIIITFCAMLIARKAAGGTRLDLTDEQSYTLSPGTVKIISELNQPLKAKLYYARSAALKGPDQIRVFNAHFLYVRDLLDEYVSLSNGRLRLEVIDPRKFSDEEDDAIAAGLRVLPITENDNFCFGLTLQSELGREKSIPFFELERKPFVEYDISKLILSVLQRDRRKVNVISSLGVGGADMSSYMVQMMLMQGRRPDPPWLIVSHLRENYDVQPLAADAHLVPDDVDFLLVVHPRWLSNKQLFAIDQFVMRGGKLVVFEDPFCMVATEGRDRNDDPRPSDLNMLLKSWGVEMDAAKIVVDGELAMPVTFGPGRSGPLLPALDLKDECFNKSEVITGNLKTVRMAFAGALQSVETEGVEFVQLIKTSATANLWTPPGRLEQLPTSEEIRRDVGEGTQPLTLACRLTGTFRTNFPEGIEIEEERPDPNTGERKKKLVEPIKESPRNTAIVVFSDVDVISDMIAYRSNQFGASTQGDNAAVLFNTLDFLSGAENLIAVRSRANVERPFEVVRKIEAEAERKTADKIKAINDRIGKYQEELRQLSAGASEKEGKLLRTEVVAQRKKLEEDIRREQKELREVSAEKLAGIEALGARLQLHVLLWAPAGVLMIAIALAVWRYVRARRYAARRAKYD